MASRHGPMAVGYGNKKHRRLKMWVMEDWCSWPSIYRNEYMVHLFIAMENDVMP